MSVWISSPPLFYWPRSCVAPEDPGVTAAQKGHSNRGPVCSLSSKQSLQLSSACRLCSRGRPGDDGLPDFCGPGSWPTVRPLHTKQDVGNGPCAKQAFSTPKSIWGGLLALEIKLRILLILEFWDYIQYCYMTILHLLRIEGSDWVFHVTEALPFKCLIFFYTFYCFLVVDKTFILWCFVHFFSPTK